MGNFVFAFILTREKPFLGSRGVVVKSLVKRPIAIFIGLATVARPTPLPYLISRWLHILKWLVNAVAILILKGVVAWYSKLWLTTGLSFPSPVELH